MYRNKTTGVFLQKDEVITNYVLYWDVMEFNSYDEYLAEFEEVGEIEAVTIRTCELYDWIGRGIDRVSEDRCSGYLTENVGSDGELYIWYMDETEDIAIRVSDGELFGEEETSQLFC